VVRNAGQADSGRPPSNVLAAVRRFHFPGSFQTLRPYGCFERAVSPRFRSFRAAFRSGENRRQYLHAIKPSQSGPNRRNTRGRNIQIMETVDRAPNGSAVARGGGRERTDRAEGTAMAKREHGHRSPRIRSRQLRGRSQAHASADPLLYTAPIQAGAAPAPSKRRPARNCSPLLRFAFPHLAPPGT